MMLISDRDLGGNIGSSFHPSCGGSRRLLADVRDDAPPHDDGDLAPADGVRRCAFQPAEPLAYADGVAPARRRRHSLLLARSTRTRMTLTLRGQLQRPIGQLIAAAGVGLVACDGKRRRSLKMHADPCRPRAIARSSARYVAQFCQQFRSG